MANNTDNENAKLSWGRESDHSLLENWPLDENGEPEKAEYLTTITALNQEANLKINMLNAYGIPVLQNFSSAGSFGRVILGTTPYGPRLFVPASLLDDAKALLNDGENAVDAELSDNSEKEQ